MLISLHRHAYYDKVNNSNTIIEVAGEWLAAFNARKGLYMVQKRAVLNSNIFEGNLKLRGGGDYEVPGDKVIL